MNRLIGRWASRLLAVLACVATFLLLAYILVYAMSELRAAMRTAEFLWLLFLNGVNIAVASFGLLAVFTTPYYVGRFIRNLFT